MFMGIQWYVVYSYWLLVFRVIWVCVVLLALWWVDLIGFYELLLGC